MQQGTQNTQPAPNRNQIILIIGVIVVAAIVLLPRLFNTAPTTQTTVPPVSQPNTSNSDTNISLGQPVAATGIDSNGCATGTTNSFSPSSSIYVVAPNSNVPQG